MRQLTVHGDESGQRFDKYLRRKLQEAPTSFLYKMLRKKNITLNGKKASGSELLKEGDLVALFLSDETLEKFGAGQESLPDTEEYISAYKLLSPKMGRDVILYENQDFAALRKPTGVLSQKAEPRDVSVNEWFIGYLLQRGSISKRSLAEFKPSVCSRLDRNTGGIILCGKTLRGSRMLTQMLRDRTMNKFYQAVVAGKMEGRDTIEGYLLKDQRTNKVSFSRNKVDGASYSKTRYNVVYTGNKYSLVELELITGKTHQLRAHLAHIGHPIAGDPKYGMMEDRDTIRKKYHVRSQLLWCCKVVFPKTLEELSETERGLIIECPVPAVYRELPHITK